jgi:DNA-binding GntR family transcriptional regulator
VLAVSDIDGTSALDAAAAGREDQPRAASLADRAHDEIRERIATRRMVPGQRLTERSLAAALGMSPTPVREALRRLEQEGLIAKQGTRTVTVVEHSPQTLAELQYAEIVLRAAAARFAAGKATPAQVSALRERVREIERAALRGIPEEILAAAGRFDALVTQVADNPFVTGLSRSAEVVGRNRRLQAVTVMLRHRRDVGLRHLAAHRDLVDAIADRDGDRAEQVVRAHLRSSLDLLLSDLEGTDPERPRPEEGG